MIELFLKDTSYISDTHMHAYIYIYIYMHAINQSLQLDYLLLVPGTPTADIVLCRQVLFRTFVRWKTVKLWKRVELVLCGGKMLLGSSPIYIGGQEA